MKFRDLNAGEMFRYAPAGTVTFVKTRAEAGPRAVSLNNGGSYNTPDNQQVIRICGEFTDAPERKLKASQLQVGRRYIDRDVDEVVYVEISGEGWIFEYDRRHPAEYHGPYTEV